MMNISGATPPLTIGPRRWPVWGSLLRSTPTWPTTAWSVSVLHTSVSAATISSPWWKNKRSCTIPLSPRHWTTLHYGLTLCTSACHTVATVTSRAAQLVATLYGRWSWTSSTVGKIPAMTNTFPDAPWLTPALTSWPVINSTTSWTTTLTAIMSRTEPHSVCTSTLPGWRTTPSSWTPSCTGSTRFYPLTMMCTLLRWPKLFSGSRTHVLLPNQRTSSHGGRSVPSKVSPPVGYPIRASWRPRKFPGKRSTCRRACVVLITTHGSTILPETVSSKWATISAPHSLPPTHIHTSCTAPSPSPVSSAATAVSKGLFVSVLPRPLPLVTAHMEL